MGTQHPFSHHALSEEMHPSQRYAQHRQVVPDQRRNVEVDMVKLKAALIPDVTPFRIFLFASWLFGLFLMNYASAPYTPPDDDIFRYDELQAKADTMTEAQEAERAYVHAYHEMNNANGWFLGAEGKRVLALRTADFEKKKAIYMKLNAERQSLRQEANSVVGIWSQYGLDATRKGFWEAYEKGKDFAKRMTWWDAMFLAIGGGGRDRDTHVLVIILQFVLRIAMNFTLGFIYSFFNFSYNLFYIIADFAPDPASAVTYYFLGVLAAFSMVMSVIIAMYGTIATVVIGGGYALAQNAALEEQRRRELGGRAHRD